MKRRNILFLVVVICSIGLHAQDRIGEKYGDKDGVKSIFFSGSLLQLMNPIFKQDTAVEDVLINLEEASILSTEREDIAKKMLADIEKEMKNDKYEELMRYKSSTDLVRFYMVQEKNVVKELIMYLSGEKGVKYFRITGTLSLVDIMNITGSKVMEEF